MQTRSARDIRRMFHDIAPSYDFLNHLLSLNIDQTWRRYVARQVITPGVERVLDVCSGTGDLAIAFARRATELSSRPLIVSTDFTAAMTLRARDKFRNTDPVEQTRVETPVIGDTLSLPFASESFDVVSVAFGIRNVQNLRGGLCEMKRVCRVGGCLAILEFSHPRSPLFRHLYEFYFFRVLPRIGHLITGTRAYSYLPRSVANFPDTGEFQSLLEEIAGTRAEAHRLSFGIATLYVVRL